MFNLNYLLLKLLFNIISSDTLYDVARFVFRSHTQMNEENH